MYKLFHIYVIIPSNLRTSDKKIPLFFKGVVQMNSFFLVDINPAIIQANNYISLIYHCHYPHITSVTSVASSSICLAL